MVLLQIIYNVLFLSFFTIVIWVYKLMLCCGYQILCLSNVCWKRPNISSSLCLSRHILKNGMCWALGHSTAGTIKALCVIAFYCLSPRQLPWVGFSFKLNYWGEAALDESVSTDCNSSRHGSLGVLRVSGGQDTEGLRLLLMIVQVALTHGRRETDAAIHLHSPAAYPGVRPCLSGGRGAFP